ncbi:MAG TPA: hypothetical protein VHF01_02595 [Candidatus Acidoferrum sp.]|nr:hypothetical protein [Candidatus Acidoferrum sp.]
MVNKQKHMAVFFLGFLVIAGCGNSKSFTPSQPLGGTAVSLSLTDTPPANVDVISFEVTVSGAALNPGNIDLLGATGPQDIDVKKLQVEKAFLNTASVPATAGPFQSLTLTFANPRLTILNGTANSLAGCAPGAVCRITPAGSLVATVNFNPTLSLSANNSVGLLVDLNLNTILTNALGVDFSLVSAVSVTQTQISPDNQNQELENVEDLTGKVANKGTNSFDLQTSQKTFSGIQVDKNTVFKGFTSCPASPPDLTCLQNGQIVDVDVTVLATGALVARKVKLEGDETNVNDEELDGFVTSVNAQTGTFAIVVADNLSALSNSVLGSPMQVQIQSGAQFTVDLEESENNSGLSSSFVDVNSLLAGQTVQIHRVSGDGSTAAPIVTDRVRLQETRLTATVKAILDANTFTIDTAKSIFFTVADVTEITVDASHASFEGVANVAALVVTPVPDTVSVRGWLFKRPPSMSPVLVTTRVRKH